MSYILEALKKSEAERRQGKAPDLGQQVQMIYRPKKKPVSAVVWVVLALIINAVVLAYVFWPSRQLPEAAGVSAAAVEPGAETSPEAPVRALQAKTEPEFQPEPVSQVPVRPAEPPQAVTESGLNEPQFEQPTIIVPNQPAQQSLPAPVQTRPQERVPHLVELPLSFQKSVPDLIFNSHIYSSDPAASRVMINNRYLRAGQSLGSLLVENITEDGVVLSKNGQRFRVGIVRDWVSPR
ncbi:general secretion pathway protein GspB [Marinobacter litoralis]|uniref:general secretion pathway protein GspB n=1 Tax=Marinobacter litoralis TaxID=187981 RepID=UPI0018EA8451|nr:general secretion pathway protein GspB [Marinobacter litoralis]MBJ6137739.1 general secretion pathway protein GspB [Marinobacter litoralis]